MFNGLLIYFTSQRRELEFVGENGSGSNFRHLQRAFVQENFCCYLFYSCSCACAVIFLLHGSSGNYLTNLRRGWMFVFLVIL